MIRKVIEVGHDAAVSVAGLAVGLFGGGLIAAALLIEGAAVAAQLELKERFREQWERRVSAPDPKEVSGSEESQPENQSINSSSLVFGPSGCPELDCEVQAELSRVVSELLTVIGDSRRTLPEWRAHYHMHQFVIDEAIEMIASAVVVRANNAKNGIPDA